MTNMDWEKVRREHQGTQGQTYLMTSAEGLWHDSVFAAYSNFAERRRVTGSLHWQTDLKVLQETRKKVAELLGGTDSDIGFLPNTSTGMNVLAMMLKSKHPGANIVLPADEFPSSVLPWYHHGFSVRQVPSRQGQIPAEDLLAAVDSETAALVTSAVQFQTGFRQDLVKLGSRLHEMGVPFIVNGTQALGAFPVDVKKARISALTASAHKWMAAGLGLSIFYCSPAFRQEHDWPLAGWLSVDNPMELRNEKPTLRSETSATEIGIFPIPVIHALHQATQLRLELGIDSISERILRLTDQLARDLRKKKIPILTPRDEEKEVGKTLNSGIITIASENALDMERRLAQENIYVNARRNGLRCSFHFYNNEEDVEKLVSLL